MGKIYFVRHGESEWNVTDQICGQTDVPLTEKGHKQAEETGKNIVESGISADLILCSPLLRAKQTAQHIAEMTGIPLQVEPRLVEQNFGVWEGASPRNSKEFHEAKKEFLTRYGKGESMFQLAQRIYNLLDELKATDKNYILVAHNGISRVIRSYFGDMTNEEYAAYGVKNCSVTMFDFSYDAVVFDMDGVIFDSERATIDCWLELAEKYNIENMEEALLMCTGTTKVRTKEIMQETYGEEFPYDTYAKEASAMYHEKYDGGRLPMKPGVVELLTYLKDKGKKIALASSTRKETVMSQLRDAKILPFFNVVICGDMVERSKPAPDIFLKACEELGVKPERAFGIEDSYNGIRASQSGGLRTIMIPDLLPANEEMRERSEVVLATLLDVINYLEA